MRNSEGGIVAGLPLATANGFQGVDVESDSMVAVHEINRIGPNSFSPFSSLILDIVNLGSFINCSFNFVRIDANGFANNLAK